MRSFGVACGCALAAIVVGSCPAQAELLVGDYRGADVSAPVFLYGDIVDGAAAPDASFGAAPLLSASSMTFDPAGQTIFVADFPGKAIRAYPPSANGNVAPTRTIDLLQVGQPRQITVSIAHDEIIEANTCCIAAFPRFASGNAVYPLRYLPSSSTPEGSRTRLNNPTGIVLRVISDEIIVPDTGSGPDGSFGVVLFFSRGVTGNSAPYHSLEGPLTLLGVAALGIAYDDWNDELIVLSQDSAPDTVRINTYASGATGNVAPLHSISGANAVLEDVHAIHYDAAAEVLYVSVGGDAGIPSRVLAFNRGADGNVAPDRIILPTGASFAAPAGIVTVSDVIFRTSFN